MNLTILLSLSFFISTSSMATPPSKEACLKQGDTPIGSSMGRNKTPGNDCCAGLKAIDQKIVCGKGYGGYAGVCSPCGDGFCDKDLENNCNCPSDCKVK
jgi:hypothetical protein